MFKNRCQAGQLLAEKLKSDLPELEKKEVIKKTVVLGIPRGGVVVAQQIARIFNCALDVIVVKKISPPASSELAIGAVGETRGSKYIDRSLASDVGANEQFLKKEIKRVKKEIKEKESLFRQKKPPLDLKDKTIIIVDDGAATGATVIAAVREVWNNQPHKVIAALPVLSKDSLKKIEKEADQVVFLAVPQPFFAVGQFYQSFDQVSNKEVISLLNQ